MFVKALPLALVCYLIAFGDFVTTETLVTEARQARDDEYTDTVRTESYTAAGNLGIPGTVLHEHTNDHGGSYINTFTNGYHVHYFPG